MATDKKNGFFISLEGSDGSGKTTQLQLLKKHFENRMDVVFTREPGGTRIGEIIRDLILDPQNIDMTPRAEAFLYAASRAQHVDEFIVPNLEAGRTVITDRYVDSSIAYQGYGHQLGVLVEKINEKAVAGLMPDLTIFLNLDPRVGRQRALDNRTPDRLELFKDSFHKRVYDGYLSIIENNKNRILVIDASDTIDNVHKAIVDAIEDLISTRGRS